MLSEEERTGAQAPVTLEALSRRAGEISAAAAEPEQRVGKEEVDRALATLQRYKAGKQNLEQRIVEDELWWELRHWEAIGRRRERNGPKPASAWLFNAILNKHADAMDNYPESVVLPRERSDEESARALSSVLPVVLEQNRFEQVYSDSWWEKLKHGTAAYGVFWDPRKENGLGDVSVRQLDLLKLFWEPGVTDIQSSKNLFIAELADTEALEAQYPQHKGKLGGGGIDIKQYCYDDTVDLTGKSVVVDWYYKVEGPSGRTVLHYAKLVGDTLLFASENEPEYRDRGWYDDGQYPVVLDVMFPEKGTPVGFGYVAVCKDPQMYIDQLSANLLESSVMGTKKRFFISNSTGVNEEEFLDWSRPLVHVEGSLEDARIREIQTAPPSGVYMDAMQMKIEELKETAANRDVNSGGAGSGVTAAAAIAALQEAGNKASRDMIAASYRAYVSVCAMVIERMAQFYDETRTFRITGGGGEYEFVELNNRALGEREAGVSPGGTTLYRKPVFDLKIMAQKKDPFSRMAQNERAKELYGLGFFSPERAQEALGALEMMEFEGKDKVTERVKEGETLMKVCQQLSAQVEQLMGLLGAAARPGGTEAGAPGPGGGAPRAAGGGTGEDVSGAIMQAHTPMTGYGEELARRSKVSV